MKYFVWFFGFVLTLLLALYTLAFTSFGNNLLKPYLQDQIQAQSGLALTLEHFYLRSDALSILLALDSNNKVLLQGSYSLFSQSFDLQYSVNAAQLSALSEFVQMPLRGSFFTKGVIIGDLERVKIKGQSDLASSDTRYELDLLSFEPQSLFATIKGLDLAKLLEMLNQGAYASARLDLDLQLSSLDLKNLQGDAKITLKEGTINTDIMQNLYNVSLPQTNFHSSSHIKLQKQDLIYTTEFVSNLATIKSKGNIQPQTLSLHLDYNIAIKELALFKPLTKTNLRGAFGLRGDLKGDKKLLVLNGISDLADSDTVFQASFKEFTPHKVHAKIKDLKLDKALYMIHQPLYTEGLFSADIHIDDARAQQLQGEIKTQISKGVLHTKLLNKEMQFHSPMPATTYTINTASTLQSNIIDSKITLDSTLLSLEINKALFKIKEGSLQSDYTLKIKDLKQLYFATQQRMRGSLVAQGELKKDKDLDLTLHTNIAGGSLQAKLHNDELRADISSLQTLDLLHMFFYPEIFHSLLDAQLNYNIAQSKGDLKGKLSKGKFTQNQIFTLFKQYAKTDLYKERFSGDLSAVIDKENITASLDLASNTSAIKTKDAKLNSQTQKMDATLTIVANKQPITATLKGDINAPKVSVDLQKFMESKAGEKVKKEIQRGAEKLLKKFF